MYSVTYAGTLYHVPLHNHLLTPHTCHYEYTDSGSILYPFICCWNFTQMLLYGDFMVTKRPSCFFFIAMDKRFQATCNVAYADVRPSARCRDAAKELSWKDRFEANLRSFISKPVESVPCVSTESYG